MSRLLELRSLAESDLPARTATTIDNEEIIPLVIARRSKPMA
jgi:hypothetical protein